MNAPEPSVPALAPHPALSRYYPDPGQKHSFVREIFDSTAPDYDRIERAMALGTGSWYRRQALARAGLAKGMRALDVAVGTGLVAREAVRLAGDPSLVLGLDPSAGMLAQTVSHLPIRVVRAVGEQLPLASDHFDFLSMGYALRHLSDLSLAFREFHRVLKPGGGLCVLEITRPQGRLKRGLLRAYIQTLVPLMSRIAGRSARSPVLWEYYWDTIEACIPPERVLESLREAGFEGATRRVELGVFSEYTARKPGG